MSDRNTAVVMVYRDQEKTDLVTGIPIVDLGISTSDGMQPTGAEGLIRIAKMQLSATSDLDVESLFFEVVRKD